MKTLLESKVVVVILTFNVCVRVDSESKSNLHLYYLTESKNLTC